jgi:hypothetical protein
VRIVQRLFLRKKTAKIAIFWGGKKLTCRHI